MVSIVGKVLQFQNTKKLIIFADNRIIVVAPLSNIKWAKHDLGLGEANPKYSKVRNRVIHQYCDLFDYSWGINPNIEVLPEGLGVLSFNIHPDSIKIEINKKGDTLNVLPLKEHFDRFPKIKVKAV